ncbi:MAG TPA: hypothetical protein VHG09_08935 [Longimicrobiales bacterium]|nr:hypothetical protein [Longimicrobiales bacterium]
MIGTLFKAVAYSKAPRATFTMLHPGKAVRFRKFQWDMRHAYAPRVTALGAAALALPVGLWLGRKAVGGANGRDEQIGWQPPETAGHRPEPVLRTADAAAD